MFAGRFHISPIKSLGRTVEKAGNAGKAAVASTQGLGSSALRVSRALYRTWPLGAEANGAMAMVDERRPED
jgi:hypothetical protein